MDDCFLVDNKPRQAQPIRGQLNLGRVLGGKAEQIGSGNSYRENRLLTDGQGANFGRVGQAEPEGRLPRSISKAPSPTSTVVPGEQGATGRQGLSPWPSGQNVSTIGNLSGFSFFASDPQLTNHVSVALSGLVG